jgi:hypothetical protein
MASSLKDRLELEETTKNPVGIAECLVSWERQIKAWGPGHVDNTEALSKDLTADLQPTAFQLVVKFQELGYTGIKKGDGQVGFIRKEQIAFSAGGSTKLQYSVIPVTAKHNLRHLTKNDKDFRAKYADALLPTVDPEDPEECELDFADLDWISSGNDRIDLSAGMKGAEGSRAALWDWGFDISIGRVLDKTEEAFTKEGHCFTLVRPDFKLEEGQKVGVAVVFARRTKPTPGSVAGSGENIKRISEEQLVNIYGKPNEVNIYTGEIIKVRGEYIECDVNSFTGCSGAIIFLLDKQQPQSVQPCDYGCAVAVHAGSHPVLTSRNLGFVLRKHTGLVQELGQEFR